MDKCLDILRVGPLERGPVKGRMCQAPDCIFDYSKICTFCKSEKLHNKDCNILEIYSREEMFFGKGK